MTRPRTADCIDSLTGAAGLETGHFHEDGNDPENGHGPNLPIIRQRSYCSQWVESRHRLRRSGLIKGTRAIVCYRGGFSTNRLKPLQPAVRELAEISREAG